MHIPGKSHGYSGLEAIFPSFPKESMKSSAPAVLEIIPAETFPNVNRTFKLDGLENFLKLVKDRNLSQPVLSQIDKSPPYWIQQHLQSKVIQHWIDRVEEIEKHNTTLCKDDRELKWSFTYFKKVPDSSDVVLGEERHLTSKDNDHKAIFSDEYPAPQSLRTVDAEIGLRIRRY